MSSIDNQVLLDSISLYYENKFPDDDQILTDALDTAKTILYGDEDNPELSTDGKTVTLDDYQDYTDFMCAGEISATVVNDEFFDDVLTVMDDLLVEGLEINDDHISLWGECPSLTSSESEITESATATSYFATPKTAPEKKTATPKTKKASSTKATKPEVATTPPETKKSGTTAVPTTIPSPLEVCNELASKITAGGGYVLYVDEGFACEFNYAPNNWSSLVLINEAGLKISPTAHIYSYYIKTGPINVADKGIISLDPQTTTPLVTPPVVVAPPAIAKPLSMSAALDLYQQGILPPDFLTYTGPPVNEETGEVLESLDLATPLQ